MHKRYSYFFVIAVIYGVLSLGQEFIKQKTKYVSHQQDIELDGEIVIKGTLAQEALINLSQIVIAFVKECLERVNEYANGEKSDLSKADRTNFYMKKMKIKKEFDQCIYDIQKIIQRLEQLITALHAPDERMQEEKQ